MTLEFYILNATELISASINTGKLILFMVEYYIIVKEEKYPVVA